MASIAKGRAGQCAPASSGRLLELCRLFIQCIYHLLIVFESYFFVIFVLIFIFRQFRTPHKMLANFFSKQMSVNITVVVQEKCRLCSLLEISVRTNPLHFTSLYHWKIYSFVWGKLIFVFANFCPTPTSSLANVMAPDNSLWLH